MIWTSVPLLPPKSTIFFSLHAHSVGCGRGSRNEVCWRHISSRNTEGKCLLTWKSQRLQQWFALGCLNVQSSLGWIQRAPSAKQHKTLICRKWGMHTRAIPWWSTSRSTAVQTKTLFVPNSNTACSVYVAARQLRLQSVQEEAGSSSMKDQTYTLASTNNRASLLPPGHRHADTGGTAPYRILIQQLKEVIYSVSKLAARGARLHGLKELVLHANG